MNDDHIKDLKQFITTLLSEQLVELRQAIRGDISRLDQKIDSLSASVAEALDNSNEETEKQLKDH